MPIEMMISGIQSDRCRDEGIFLLTTTFRGEKKRRRRFSFATVEGKEAISDRYVRMYRFNFHFRLAPSNFPGVHTRVNDFIWRSGDVVLGSAFAKASRTEEDCQKRRETARVFQPAAVLE